MYGEQTARRGLIAKSGILVAIFLFSLMISLVANLDYNQPSEELQEKETPKFTTAQERLLWSQKVAGSQSTDTVEAIGLDAAGNTYVCGYFYGTATFGTITLHPQGSTDGYVGKIGPSGNWLWVNKMGGSSSDQCKDLDVDDGGNISITGYFDNSAMFGSNSFSSRGSYDIFVAKLDTNGTWLWAIQAGGSSTDYGYGVALGNDGRVYITGSYYSSGTVYFGSFTLSTYSYDEAYVAALDTNGVFIWANRMYESNNQRGMGIDVNDNGDIAITGEFSYRINFGPTCGQLNPSYASSSYYRIYVAKYTPSGSCVWAKMAGYLSSSYSSYGKDVAIDNSGEVAITGWFNYRAQFDNTWVYAYQQNSNWDCFVAKYDTQGSNLWVQAVGGSSTDYCYGLDMDPVSGNITITGMYQNTAWFGNTYISSMGGSDAFFGTLIPDPQNPSAYIWDTIHHFGGSSTDYSFAVASRNGTTVYGGYFHSNAMDDTNTLTLSSIGGADGWILVYGTDSDGDGVGDGTDVFPNDPSQWYDRDGDGFGDNLSGTNGDDCPDVFGNSTGGGGYYGCPDNDGDGWPDANDHLPNDSTQWEDTDGDGFGNNPNGTNPDGCPMMWGNSWRDQYGCLDLDGDGQSVLNDRFPSRPTQWGDADGDGMGDNWADGSWNNTRAVHWPGMWVAGAYSPDPSPFDWDNDGFEDNGIENSVSPYDDCEYDAGDSWKGLIGCPDSDGDGWADLDDAIPNNPDQNEDSDGDGYGDNQNGSEPDACPTRAGNSSVDRFGCPDNDGDGLSNDNDDCPTVAGLPTNGCPDRDGDGYVDEAEESDEPVDDCPDDYGTSFEDRFGCLDSDGDGWSDEGDPFEDDNTQWEDSDGDGWGDNQEGNDPDNCPARPGNSSLGGLLGCEDWDGDGYSDSVDPFPQDGLIWSDLDGDGYADQPGSNMSDDCPSNYGNSTTFMLGCPDMDGDGIPDSWDWDIDGDGYSNTDEVRSDPVTNPLDPTSVPVDSNNDGRADDVAESELADSALLQDDVGKVVTAAVLLLVLFSTGVILLQFTSSSRARKMFERMEEDLGNAEGFQGLADLEDELDESLRAGTIAGSQGMLLRHKIDERRAELEEELRISQQAEWWAQMGQQQQAQYGGWYPTEGQAQWYGQYDQQGHGQQGQQ